MENCIFCKIVRGEFSSKKVYENSRVYAFLDISPVNEYHTLVIPKKHYSNIFDIPEEELKEVIFAVKKICNLYNEKLGIENVQIINNSGSEAQQDVFHIHFHIIPRKKGDGQDISWKTHPDLRVKFEEMLEKLK
jgi:histidine triad (HIT) family protein